MPPLVNSGYTFTSFLERLERSALSHIAPLYHEHQLLFTQRPDMFNKAIFAISWDRGLELINTAYYVQPIELQTYRALLARMLLHNQYVHFTHAGSCVPWQAALRVYEEAILTHGLKVSNVMTRSLLRLLAPHRRANEAITVLKLAQANGKLTKQLLIEGARVCATREKWSESLSFLMHVHDQEPTLLYNTIQSLRPPHTSLLGAEDTLSYSLLPEDLEKINDDNNISRSSNYDDEDEGKDELASINAWETNTHGPTARQRHIIHILNDVISVVPPEISLSHPLCRSYLTHLIASTTLNANEKTSLLIHALAPFSWEVTLHLLTTYTEPNLLTSSDWAEMLESEATGGTLQIEPATISTTSSTTTSTTKKSNKKKSARKRIKMSKHKRMPTCDEFNNNIDSQENANSLHNSRETLTDDNGDADKKNKRETEDIKLRKEKTSVHKSNKKLESHIENNVIDEFTQNRHFCIKIPQNVGCNDVLDHVKFTEKTSIPDKKVNYQQMFHKLHSRLQWLQGAHAASMMAVMIAKFPTPLMALEFVKSCNVYLKNINERNELSHVINSSNSNDDDQNATNNLLNTTTTTDTTTESIYTNTEVKQSSDINSEEEFTIKAIERAVNTENTSDRANEVANTVEESSELPHVTKIKSSVFQWNDHSNHHATISATHVTRHPVVIHALLQKCTSTISQQNTTHSLSSRNGENNSRTNSSNANFNSINKNNNNNNNVVMGYEQSEDDTPTRWQVASHILLEWSGPHVTTATDILSDIVIQLRKAKQTGLMIRILNEHIVPSHGKLKRRALLAMMEAILAHNRAIHLTEIKIRTTHTLTTECNRQERSYNSCVDFTGVENSATSDKIALELQELPSEVHWKSALSWALDLQAVEEQPHQIIETGTGPSAGAASRHCATKISIDKKLSSSLLNILLSICVEAGNAKAALRALGYARRVGKVELLLSSEIRALLYCIIYNRPNEAVAIVTHASNKFGRSIALPLRKLLALAQSYKKLERLRTADNATELKMFNVTDEALKTVYNKRQQEL